MTYHIHLGDTVYVPGTSRGRVPPDLRAQRGWVLLNGGRNAGVVAASAKVAKKAGGTVIGIRPGTSAHGASPDLDIAIVTGMGDARNVANVLCSDVIIALPGGAGTLSEIALALKSGKPVVLLQHQAPAALEPRAPDC